MQSDNFDDQDRERLERLLSHPESAEYLTEALSKAIVSEQKPPVVEGKPEVNQEPEPAQSDAAINIARHFMISGGLLAGVLLLAAAVATPLRDTFTVCFNPHPAPNTSKCLGVKSYSIDQDHIEKLVAHPSLVVVPDKKGNPALAVGLALFGTAFATGSGFIAKQALKEKTEAMPINRTNRRTTWTANKLEADKFTKQRYQDLTQGFAIATNTNQHALAVNDTFNEFDQLYRLLAALKPNEREAFLHHLEVRAQERALEQQAQLQAQQQQSPFAALLGSVPEQQAGLIQSTDSDSIPEWGKHLMKVLIDYKIECKWAGFIDAPSVLRVKLNPGKGQKVAPLERLASDLKVKLGYESSPLVSAQSGYIAVDIPKKQEDRRICRLEDYTLRQNEITIPVGVEVEGNLVEVALSDPNNPHFLVGGQSGSGKSEWLVTVALSLVKRFPKERVKLIIIDPKQVTFAALEGLDSVQDFCTEKDHLNEVLTRLVNEQERRYTRFVESGVKDFAEYEDRGNKDFPRLVLLFDEYADFIEKESTGFGELSEEEMNLQRLARKGRAAGIHLFIALQRPDGNAVNPQIRANLTAQIGVEPRSM